MDTYLTQPGDQWDLIAKKTLGSEYYADALMKANLDQLDIFTFGYGTELILPPTPATSNSGPWWRQDN